MKLILHLKEDYLLNGKKRRFQSNLMIQIHLFDNSIEFLKLKRINQMKKGNSSIEILNSTETTFIQNNQIEKNQLFSIEFIHSQIVVFIIFITLKQNIWWNSLNWLFLNNFGQKEKFSLLNFLMMKKKFIVFFENLNTGNGNLINPGFLRNPKSRVLKFLVNKKKCFISKKTIWKTQKYFSFSFFSSPQKTIEKTKISLFDQNYSEIINSMNFIIFLFQSDKNDENNNLRMNKINWKQMNLFNLIVLNESCFCWIEFFNWWISSFSSDSFFSNWGIQSNHQVKRRLKF